MSQRYMLDTHVVSHIMQGRDAELLGRLTKVPVGQAVMSSVTLAELEASGPMSFFITSVGSGKGADLGGLAGADAHCQKLATAAGAGGKTWRAYLSVPGAFPSANPARHRPRSTPATASATAPGSTPRAADRPRPGPPAQRQPHQQGDRARRERATSSRAAATRPTSTTS
jgi:hypothetical protein